MRRLPVIVIIFCLSLCTIARQVAADDKKVVDVLLIGGGIMSATLATYLQELEPDWSISMYERLDAVAKESSNGWNNAGTGHSALAEMNYTPEKKGFIEIAKAVEINEAFQISRQFWAHQVKKNALHNPQSFITTVPHMSFVWGEENIRFLRKRHTALQQSTLFRGMEYTEDAEQIKQWVPLMMEGRDPEQKIAATRSVMGTDVNFGEITRQLVDFLSKQKNFSLHLHSEVKDIKRNSDKTWSLTVADLQNEGKENTVNARFVFIGAGGASLPLLQKSGIPEIEGYGGFPIGGSFLVAENPELVKRHLAKVYGKALVGSPPMSVPHLDTRVLDGKSILLFGPFATFSSKFLKNGSLWDLFKSLTFYNIMPMTHVSIDNFDLINYLISQVISNDNDRFEALKEYLPEAKEQDWKLLAAGQRVQVIKKDTKKGGVLNLGTEVVISQDGTIAGLLGASPGASTAASIMLDLMETIFKDKFASQAWQSKLKSMIPSYGYQLNGNVDLTDKVFRYTNEVLQLDTFPLKVEAAP